MKIVPSFASALLLSLSSAWLCHAEYRAHIDVKECATALSALRELTGSDPDRSKVESSFLSQLNDRTLAPFLSGYCRAVQQNISSKAESSKEGIVFSVDDLVQHTLEFEAFRLTTFLSAGVSPKRYFGFLDERGKTMEYERELKKVGSLVADHLNAYAIERGVESRVTAKEIIVTYLAEGGALLMTDEYENIDRVHPVRHVGLDDYRIGFDYFPGLLDQLDETFRTRLGSIRIEIGEKSFLLRPMTFRESILATGVMYLYEKELTNIYRIKNGRTPLMQLPLSEQFVHTSLVYNSGILFADDRVHQIQQFDTRDYLLSVSEENAHKRPRLPLLTEAASLVVLRDGNVLPRQLTSWSAVYHILQRYGAWVSLERYSKFFDEHGRVVRSRPSYRRT